MTKGPGFFRAFFLVSEPQQIAAPDAKACRDDRSVLYHRVPRLFDALALARGDGRHARMLKSLARVELLNQRVLRRGASNAASAFALARCAWVPKNCSLPAA